MAADDLETLDGEIERVNYRDEASGFTVARFTVAAAAPPGPQHPDLFEKTAPKAKAPPEPVTIIGAMPGVGPGTPLQLRGRWVQDKKWGKQFKVDTYQTRSPATLVGIERFLGSGMVPGIGPE